MRATILLTVILFFALNVGKDKVNAQVVAVGHAFAEVVESVSAASATITDFELVKADSEATGDSLTTGMLNLGAITINTGKNITCNIVLLSSPVTDDRGNAFTIDTTVQNPLLSSEVKSTGVQTIKLGANANLSNDQASGLYEGSYTVVFAYN